MAESRELILIAKFKDEMSKQLNTVSSSLSALGKVAVGAAILSVGKSFITAAAQIEQTTVAFNTMLGSAELAQVFLKDLANFAANTPFEVTGVEQSAKQLMAYGFSVEEIIPTLKSLGDVSAGLSVPLEQIVYAYGQVRAAGQLYGTELRQFVNAGVPILQSLADQYGVTTAEAKQMVEDGKVGFNDVQKAFQGMSGEGGKFFNLMENQSKTLGGMWSNLKDQMTIFMRENSKGLAELAKALITGALAAIKFYNEHKEIINTIIKVIAVFATTYIVLSKLQAAWGLVTTAVKFLGVAMQAMMAHPIILFLALAAAGVMFLADRFGGLQNAFIVIGKTMVILANVVVGGLKTMANMVISFVNKALVVGNKIYNFFSDLLSKVGVDIGKADMKIDFEFDTQGNANNINAMLIDIAKMREAKVNSEKQTNSELAIQYGLNNQQFAGAQKKNTKEAEDAAEKMKEKFKDLMTSNADAIRDTYDKIKDLYQKISDLEVGYAQDTVEANASIAGAYVDQETKVADLKKQVAEKQVDYNTTMNEDVDSGNIASHNQKMATLQTELDTLKATYAQELAVFESKKTIELAYENEVNEVRRRNHLTEFERKLEDLSNARTIMNQEFQAKYDSLQKELNVEKERYLVLSDLRAWALKEADKSLALGEKQTAASINKQIEYYNRLADAVRNAQKGSYTSYATVAKETAARAGATNVAPSVTINIKGDVSGQEVVDKVKGSIMNDLRNNTQLAF